MRSTWCRQKDQNFATKKTKTMMDLVETHSQYTWIHYRWSHCANQLNSYSGPKRAYCNSNVDAKPWKIPFIQSTKKMIHVRSICLQLCPTMITRLMTNRDTSLGRRFRLDRSCDSMVSKPATTINTSAWWKEGRTVHWSLWLFWQIQLWCFSPRIRKYLRYCMLLHAIHGIAVKFI